jgi:ribonuclease T2
LRKIPGLGFVTGFFSLLALTFSATAQRDQSRGQPGEFDFYVLALSWSPSFCLTEGRNRPGAQCAADARFGFVVHGLWPQYDRGWPQFCAGNAPERVADGTIARMQDIMPSRGLVLHQWRKHGTCSGLAPQAYFDTVRRAANVIRIPDELQRPAAQLTLSPDEVETAFLRTNPSLGRDMISISCQAGMLDEVKVCLSRTLTPRRCTEVDTRSCRAPRMSIPPVGRS